MYLRFRAVFLTASSATVSLPEWWSCSLLIATFLFKHLTGSVAKSFALPQHTMSWDESLQEWTTATGNAEAAALAQLADGAFYAACPTAGEAGWGIVYKDDHEEEILQADGETVKKVMVNEASTLLSVVTTGKAPPEGLWLGGNKYRITRTDDNEECGDHTLKWIQANYPKHGVHIIVTKSQIVVGFFDEDKQSSGNCKKVTCDFAAYPTSLARATESRRGRRHELSERASACRCLALVELSCGCVYCFLGLPFSTDFGSAPLMCSCGKGCAFFHNLAFFALFLPRAFWFGLCTCRNLVWVDFWERAFGFGCLEVCVPRISWFFSPNLLVSRSLSLVKNAEGIFLGGRSEELVKSQF